MELYGYVMNCGWAVKGRGHKKAELGAFAAASRIVSWGLDRTGGNLAQSANEDWNHEGWNSAQDLGNDLTFGLGLPVPRCSRGD